MIVRMRLPSTVYIERVRVTLDLFLLYIPPIVIEDPLKLKLG